MRPPNPEPHFQPSTAICQDISTTPGYTALPIKNGLEEISLLHRSTHIIPILPFCSQSP